MVGGGEEPGGQFPLGLPLLRKFVAVERQEPGWWCHILSPGLQRCPATGITCPTSPHHPLAYSSAPLPAPAGKPTHKGTHGEVYTDGNGKKYRCSQYMRGFNMISTWYEIDNSGARKLATSFRPPDVNKKALAKMTEEQKLQKSNMHR